MLMVLQRRLVLVKNVTIPPAKLSCTLCQTINYSLLVQLFNRRAATRHVVKELGW